ncbi:hypothetical protein OpiT1DRAFT_02525 [Opitutaceae bacterium TAV1]|nr:hypothetical protein OpiT1DRAFT_02525 [Opitutaceae bacterium TAV1]
MMSVGLSSLMKKLTVLFLAVSLTANAAFIARSAWRAHRESSDGAADSGRNAARLATAGKNARAGGSASVGESDLLEALRGDDPAALRDVLRAAGVDDRTLRMIVSSTIWRRYSDRMKALQPQPDPETLNKNWWKENPWEAQYNRQTKEQRAEARRLQREVRDTLENLLGKDPEAGRYGGWVDPRTSFLPEGKRTSIQEVEQDYAELTSELYREAGRFQVPSDAEAMRVLQESKKQDLAALLTPEEFAQYELRNSQTTQQLRGEMAQFDASEDEFLSIYSLRKEFDERYSNNDMFGMGPRGRDQDYWKQRQEAEKQLNEQIRQALGEERYTDYRRAKDYDYQQLVAAGKRFGLPENTASQLYDLRDATLASSKRLAADDTLTAEQKKESLKTLAADMRNQVTAALGQEAATAYFNNGRMNWLQQMEKGYVVELDDNGQSTRIVNLTSPPKKKK